MTTPPRPFPLHRVPWLLLAAVTVLLLVGLSAIERGDELVGFAGTADKQLVWIALGVPVLAAAAAVVCFELVRRSRT